MFRSVCVAYLNVFSELRLENHTGPKKYKLASDELPIMWIISEPDLSVTVPGNNSLFAYDHSTGNRTNSIRTSVFACPPAEGCFLVLREGFRVSFGLKSGPRGAAPWF